MSDEALQDWGLSDCRIDWGLGIDDCRVIDNLRFIAN
jgi:hypothetical protein